MVEKKQELIAVVDSGTFATVKVGYMSGVDLVVLGRTVREVLLPLAIEKPVVVTSDDANPNALAIGMIVGVLRHAQAVAVDDRKRCTIVLSRSTLLNEGEQFPIQRNAGGRNSTVVPNGTRRRVRTTV